MEITISDIKLHRSKSQRHFCQWVRSTFGIKVTPYDFFYSSDEKCIEQIKEMVRRENRKRLAFQEFNT